MHNPDTLTGPDQVAHWLQARVVQAFTSANRTNQALRPDPFGMSISAIGRCDKQAAHRIAGTEPSDPHLAGAGEARAAMLGTWIHAGLLPVLADVLVCDDPQPTNWAQDERPVTLTAAGIPVRGTTDLYTPRHGGICLDLKTVREYALNTLAGQDGPFPDHFIQVSAYSLALHQSGYPVRWMAWLYLDRASGDLMIKVAPFDADASLAVVNRMTRLAQLADNPDQAPRTERGPGFSYQCDQCPWLRRCWGPDAAPRDTAAPILAAVPQDAAQADVEALLKAYSREREQTAKHKKEQDFYKQIIESTGAGSYGELGWHHSGGRDVFDAKEGERLLVEAGIPVPMKPGSRRFLVTRAKG